MTAPREMRGEPSASLYPPGMVKRVMLGVQELRRWIGQLTEAIERDEHIVLTFRGKVFAVITPIKWYREAAIKMKDPTEY
jgi:hypothetical protein